MSKNVKKILIYIGIGILLFAAGFGAGRGLRLARTSKSSGELEQRINEGLDTASDISNRSDIAGAIADSAASSGQAIAAGTGAVQYSSEELGVFWSEVIRAIEADQEAAATFKQIHSGSSGAAVDAIDIAIQHSEQYEELISSLQRAVDNLNENNQESK